MSGYRWYWEDEPDFLLPHAAHIVVQDNEGEEMCLIVVRHPFSHDRDARARAERKAQDIVLGLDRLDDEEAHASLYHIDDPRSHE